MALTAQAKVPRRDKAVWVRGHGEADAIIGDEQSHDACAAEQRDLQTGGARVAESVVKRLLRRAVQHELDSR